MMLCPGRIALGPKVHGWYAHGVYIDGIRFADASDSWHKLREEHPCTLLPFPHEFLTSIHQLVTETCPTQTLLMPPPLLTTAPWYSVGMGTAVVHRSRTRPPKAYIDISWNSTATMSLRRRAVTGRTASGTAGLPPIGVAARAFRSTMSSNMCTTFTSSCPSAAAAAATEDSLAQTLSSATMLTSNAGASVNEVSVTSYYPFR